MFKNRQSSISRRQLGFTSLEFTNGFSAAALMIVATISGAFDFVSDLKRVNVVNQMLNGFQVARATAHKYSATVTFCPSLDQKTCSPAGDWSAGWIAFIDKNANGEIDGRDASRVFARASYDSSDISIRTEFDRFSFAPGRSVQISAADAAATICVVDGRGTEYSRVIWINARGHAELHKTRPQREIDENAARDFSQRSTECY